MVKNPNFCSNFAYMRKWGLILLFLIANFTVLRATDLGGVIRIDKTVHDFGKIRIDDGAVSCDFNVTNIGEEKMSILTVVSTCGCTSVKWTRTSIEPGESGVISATYKNEDGPFPFDKTLKVYFSNYSKPVVLHLKGVVKKK